MNNYLKALENIYAGYKVEDYDLIKYLIYDYDKISRKLSRKEGLIQVQKEHIKHLNEYILELGGEV